MSTITIQCTVSRCRRATRKTTTDATYLIDCNIVTRLLKAGGVVVLVPHDNPHLVENNSTDQLVGALDLHHNGHDVVRGLEKRKKKHSFGLCGGWVYFLLNTRLCSKIIGWSQQTKNSTQVCVCVCACHFSIM